MKTYVSRSGRDCSWKIPKACMNSCWNVPTLWILLNSIQYKLFSYWKSKILSLWITTSANGEDLLSVICPSNVTVTSATLENSYILILALPWLQINTCSKSIISFSICNSIQKYCSIVKSFFHISSWLHRCWRRMLETKRVDDNSKVLVTILVILITNIHDFFTLASGTNIQKMSPTSRCHQHLCQLSNLFFV